MKQSLPCIHNHVILYTSITDFNPRNVASQAKKLAKTLDTFDIINILYECVCMYVCMCVGMYVFMNMYIYMHVYMHVCMYVYIYVHMYINIYIYMH